LSVASSEISNKLEMNCDIFKLRETPKVLDTAGWWRHQLQHQGEKPWGSDFKR